MEEIPNNQVGYLKKRLENNGDTPSKTNMEPEHEPLEEEIPMKNPSFLGSMLVFGGINYQGTRCVDGRGVFNTWLESVFPLVFGVQAAARLFSAQFHWYSRFVSAILLCSMTKVRFLWTRKLLAFWHFDLDLEIFLKFFQKVLWCFWSSRNVTRNIIPHPTPPHHVA